jgi:hypothetical protein
MREKIKNSVREIMLEGINPAGVRKMLEGVQGIDSQELWDVIQEVKLELANEDIIYWGGQN